MLFSFKHVHLMWLGCLSPLTLFQSERLLSVPDGAAQHQKQLLHTLHVRCQCDHTRWVCLTVSVLWPLERETLNTLKKDRKEKGSARAVLKSQFLSASSVALTRSGWQQEFVSPPNLEITFSGARRGPPFLAFPFCLSGCNPASPAFYREVTSQDPLTAQR